MRVQTARGMRVICRLPEIVTVFKEFARVCKTTADTLEEECKREAFMALVIFANLMANKFQEVSDKLSALVETIKCNIRQANAPEKRNALMYKVRDSMLELDARLNQLRNSMEKTQEQAIIEGNAEHDSIVNEIKDQGKEEGLAQKRFLTQARAEGSLRGITNEPIGKLVNNIFMSEDFANVQNTSLYKSIMGPMYRNSNCNSHEQQNDCDSKEGLDIDPRTGFHGKIDDQRKTLDIITRCLSQLNKVARVDDRIATIQQKINTWVIDLSVLIREEIIELKMLLRLAQISMTSKGQTKDADMYSALTAMREYFEGSDEFQDLKPNAIEQFRRNSDEKLAIMCLVLLKGNLSIL